jgi:hypothetical protein
VKIFIIFPWLGVLSLVATTFFVSYKAFAFGWIREIVIFRKSEFDQSDCDNCFTCDDKISSEVLPSARLLGLEIF